MSGADGLELPEGYTPGPWWTAAKYDGQQMGCSIIAARTDCGPMPGNPTRGAVAWATAVLNTEARRCEANARLIALAPQMADEIAALRARLAEWNEGIQAMAVERDSLRDMVLALRAELEAARTLPEHDVALREWEQMSPDAAALQRAEADRDTYRMELAAARTVTPEMVERALDAYYSDGKTECRDMMRAALEAAIEAAMAMGVNDGR